MAPPWTRTSVNIGGSLFLCAVSTAIGFFAFIPTDYTGVAELGWISGFGMFISFAVTITVIPALLSLLRFHAGRFTWGKESGPGGARLVERHAGKILGATACLTLASAVVLGGLRFDHNPLNLHAQDGAALTTYRELLADNDLTPWTAIMIAADAERRKTVTVKRSAAIQTWSKKWSRSRTSYPPARTRNCSSSTRWACCWATWRLAPPDPAAQTEGTRLGALRGFLREIAGNRGGRSCLREAAGQPRGVAGSTRGDGFKIRPRHGFPPARR